MVKLTKQMLQSESKKKDGFLYFCGIWLVCVHPPNTHSKLMINRINYYRDLLSLCLKSNSYCEINCNLVQNEYFIVLWGAGMAISTTKI
jgi:hypothetical protein